MEVMNLSRNAEKTVIIPVININLILYNISLKLLQIINNITNACLSR